MSFTNSCKRVCLRDDSEAENIEDPISTDFINLLDDYCLENIFTYLPIFQRLEMDRVCTRWESVNQLPWCDIKTFDCKQHYCSDDTQKLKVEKALLHCDINIKQLSLCELCVSIVLPIAIQKFNALRRLSLKGGILKGNDFNRITQMNTLVHLDLAFNILDRPAQSIFNLINLEHLNLDRATGFGSSAFISIANKCVVLKYLNISFCNNISELALRELAKLKNLEQLVMASVVNANDDMFRKMYKLQVLECSNCYSLTDVGIMDILKNCSSLHRLDVRGTGITTETLICAAKETKCRKNGVVLKLTTSYLLTRDFDQSKNMSPMLIITEGDFISPTYDDSNDYDNAYNGFDEHEYREYDSDAYDDYGILYANYGYDD